MPLDIPHAHATCVHRDDLFVKAGKTALIFGDQLRLKGAVPIPRNRDLQRFAIGQYRLLGITIAVIIGIFSLRNLILLRFCQVLVHLGVQHPICQGFSELAHQSCRRKYLLRVLTHQQLVKNLALDRHTLSPSSLKYGSDTQNFRYSREEYKGENPGGYQYSQFAELYRRFEERLSVVLRQPHGAGEKCFVDFCDGLALIDQHTGERIATQLFVGALGASSFTFARATLSQELPVWLDCHVCMYEAFDGVAAITVPDNLRSGITKPDRYEAEINPSYRELAEHYGTCIIAARVKKPRDKAKVEAAVLVAQRWILAVLRHRSFYHLQDLNAAIDKLLAKLNDRKMRHVKQSRRELYERIDRPALKALPAQAYEFADWKQVGVNIDYHIAFDEHFYSVPYTLVGESMWCRATGRTIELIHQGKRITTHVRSFVKYDYSTHPEHRPASRRAYLKWTPLRLI